MFFDSHCWLVLLNDKLNVGRRQDSGASIQIENENLSTWQRLPGFTIQIRLIRQPHTCCSSNIRKSVATLSLAISLSEHWNKERGERLVNVVVSLFSYRA